MTFYQHFHNFFDHSTRDELKKIIAIAWPSASGILFRLGMDLTDLAFLGRLGTDQLAAASYAIIWISLTMTFLVQGLDSATSTLCSQALGAENYKLVGIWLQVSIFTSIIFSFPVMFSWWFVDDILSGCGVNDHESLEHTKTFAQIASAYVIPTIVTIVLNSYLTAHKVVLPRFFINFFCFLINIALNEFLVFGVHGWGGLGFIGSPMATVIARYLQLLMTLIVNFYWYKHHKSSWFGWDPKEFLKIERLKQFISLAAPMTISGVLEDLQIEATSLMASHIDKPSLGTHNILIEIIMVLSSALYGLMNATIVRIGFYLGSGNPKGAQLTAKCSYLISIFLGTIVAVVIITFREFIGELFSSDHEVQHLFNKISLLTGVSYIALSIFFSSISVLQAQGRTQFILIGFIVGAWCVTVPLSYVFGFILDLNLSGIWFGLVAGYAVTTIITFGAVLKSDWKAVAENAQIRSETKEHTLNKNIQQPLLSKIHDDDNDEEYHG